MRPMGCLSSIAALFLTVGLVRSGETIRPHQIIDRAIEAHGGAARLSKFKAAVIKGKGTLYPAGEALPFTSETAVEGKERTRTVIKATVKSKPFTIITVVNGEKGWLKINDTTTRMNKEQLEEEHTQLYVDWLGRLVPLKTKGFQLTALGEIKVDGKPAVGVRVRHEGRPAVNLYFDKGSNLLVKSEFRTKVIGKGKTNPEATQDVVYKNYKAFDGVQYPTRIRINREGVPFLEVEITELHLYERLDEDFFREP
jgi:hypothetical protein